MAKVSLATIKNWFKTGLKPTQVQFWDTWDSFRHKDDSVPASEVSGLDNLLAGKAEATHLIDPNAHEALFEANGLQMIELDWSGENPMDPAGITPIDFLNNLAVPLVLTKRSIVKIKYRFTEASDGDVAVTNQWMLLLLEAGSYGNGFLDVAPTLVNEAFINELQLSSRNLKLSSANTFNASTQDEWNAVVADRIDFEHKPSFYKYGIIYEITQESIYPTTHQFQFFSDEAIKCSGTFKILQNSVNGGGWSNVVQYDSTLGLGIDKKYSFIIGYFDNGGGNYDIEFLLQESTSNDIWKQWVFYSQPQLSLIDNTFDFDVSISITDMLTERIDAVLIVNGTKYSIAADTGLKLNANDKLAGYVFQSGTFTGLIRPRENIINWHLNFPGSFELYKLSASFYNSATPPDLVAEVIQFKDSRGFINTSLGKSFLSFTPIVKDDGFAFYRDAQGNYLKLQGDSFLSPKITIPIPYDPLIPWVPNGVFINIERGIVSLSITDSFEYVDLGAINNEVVLMDIPAAALPIDPYGVDITGFTRFQIGKSYFVNSLEEVTLVMKGTQLILLKDIPFGPSYDSETFGGLFHWTLF